MWWIGLPVGASFANEWRCCQAELSESQSARWGPVRHSCHIGFALNSQNKPQFRFSFGY
jgi:hypothetical protein